MKHDTELDKLESLKDWQLENSDQDIRGRTLITNTGEELGAVEDLLVDTSGERVAAVRLADGRACVVEHIEIFDDRVVYAPVGAAATGAAAAEVIPQVTEEVAIGKRAVEGDTIRVRSRVVADQVSEDVVLKDQTVEVDRRDANVVLSETDADALLKDRVVEVTEVGEEAVVAKTAKVTGEVVVSTDTDETVETVTETVRRTEVEVDRDAKNPRKM